MAGEKQPTITAILEYDDRDLLGEFKEEYFDDDDSDSDDEVVQYADSDSHDSHDGCMVPVEENVEDKSGVKSVRMADSVLESLKENFEVVTADCFTGSNGVKYENVMVALMPKARKTGTVPFPSLPQTFVPLPTQKLRPNKYLTVEDLFRILRNGKPQYLSIPDGVKEDTYFTVWNRDNIQRRDKGYSSRFVDDCGPWNTKQGNTATTRFVFRDGKFETVFEDGGELRISYKLKNDLTEPKVDSNEIIIMKRKYVRHTLNCYYRRRVTWLEQIPGLPEEIRNMAIVEYVGTHPSNLHLNGEAGKPKPMRVKTKTDFAPPPKKKKYCYHTRSKTLRKVKRRKKK